MGVATAIGETFHAATPHRVDLCSDDPLRDSLPLQLQHSEEILTVSGRWMVLLYTSPLLIPQMLDGIEVGTIHREDHPVDAGLHKEVFGHPGSM